MTDIPVIFSAPMVRALIDGRKTMTRRLAIQERKVRETKDRPAYHGGFPSPWQKVKPGDRLWVRETHNVQSAGYKDGTGHRIAYRATDPDWPYGWTPAIHMFRFASRLTLTVTATKIERLDQISEPDAIAEGVEADGPCWRRYAPLPGDRPESKLTITVSPILSFWSLWRSLHGAESWPDRYAAPQEVVALTFTVAQKNIDAA